MSGHFVSTRSESPSVDFYTAILDGLAPDGGLYLRETIPTVGPSWKSANSFPELAGVILREWLTPDVPDAVVERVIQHALDFPVPVVPLQGDEWKDIAVVELFHGPTLSFKDFGARCMAGFMNEALGDDHRIILVATSGDTGSAVADGFSDFENTEVVLLYPFGQVSPTQERQLIARRPGVRTFAVDGSFDDCQRMVKEAFVWGKSRGMPLSSANSINIGRLLPQMSYYFWAARAYDPGSLACCVPSGNLGNLTAGVLASVSGMKIHGFVAAHNANDFLVRYLQSGRKDYVSSVRTLSNAMDVGVPSNFERLTCLMDYEQLRRLISSTSISDEDTIATMRNVYEATGYLSDPHTAVGLAAVQRHRRQTGDNRPAIVMGTAHPSKFPETVAQAVGFKPEIPERLARCWDMDTSVSVIRPAVDHLLSVMLD